MVWTVPVVGLTDEECAELERRVRAHTTPQRTVKRARVPAEQPVLGCKHFDVGTGIAATGQHQHGLDKYPTPVMDRPSTPSSRPPRQCRTDTHPIGETTQRMQADISHHLAAARFHNHVLGAGSVHLRDALLVGVLHVSQHAVSRARRAISRIHPHTIAPTREGSGLVPARRARSTGPWTIARRSRFVLALGRTRRVEGAPCRHEGMLDAPLHVTAAGSEHDVQRTRGGT